MLSELPAFPSLFQKTEKVAAALEALPGEPAPAPLPFPARRRPSPAPASQSLPAPRRGPRLPLNQPLPGNIRRPGSPTRASFPRVPRPLAAARRPTASPSSWEPADPKPRRGFPSLPHWERSQAPRCRPSSARAVSSPLHSKAKAKGWRVLVERRVRGGRKRAGQGKVRGWRENGSPC